MRRITLNVHTPKASKKNYKNQGMLVGGVGRVFIDRSLLN